MKQQTFKDWIKTTYDEDELKEIHEQGCANVAPGGAIYYHETCALYDKYVNEIWMKLWEDYRALGYESILEMLATFNGSKNVSCDEQFKNMLVWFYIEMMAGEILNEGAERE